MYGFAAGADQAGGGGGADQGGGLLISAPPQFSPAAGTFTQATVVTLTSVPGADVYYTLDGSPPGINSSSVPSGGTVTVPTTVTLRAAALEPGGTLSDEVTGIYVISAGSGGGGGYIYVTLPLSLTNLSPVQLSAGDAGPSRTIQFVDSGGRIVPISATAVVLYRLRARGFSGSAAVLGVATILSRELGVARYDFPAGTIPAAGNYFEEWVISDAGSTMTFPSQGYQHVQIKDTLQ